VLFARGGVIVHPHGEVDFPFAQVVGFLAVPQPGQLQLEVRFAVAEENELEGPVVRILFADGGKAERLGIEPEAPFEVEHVEVEMIERKFHDCTSVGIILSREAGKSKTPPKKAPRTRRDAFPVPRSGENQKRAAYCCLTC
jgi:hypothetical protein